MQIMHHGAFDDEPETIALMDSFLAEAGYVHDFGEMRLHHDHAGKSGPGFPVFSVVCPPAIWGEPLILLLPELAASSRNKSKAQDIIDNEITIDAQCTER